MIYISNLKASEPTFYFMGYSHASVTIRRISGAQCVCVFFLMLTGAKSAISKSSFKFEELNFPISTLILFL
jgi:hypothetical protein